MNKIINKNKIYIKSILIVLISQALSYFILKQLITDYNLISPTVKFPLIKSLAIIYNSWYPFIFYTSYLIYKKDLSHYKKLIYSFVIGIILSHLTFIIYPTIIERPVIESKNIFNLILNITYKLDTPAVHCIPSVHCLLCFITIYYITSSKKFKTKSKIIINAYLLLIILSTLLTNQHYLIDAIIALIYSCIAIIFTKLLYKKIKKVLRILF